MKVFFSVDIEGTAAYSLIEDFKSTTRSGIYFQDQLTREVAAACEGAFEAGAELVTVRDSHATGTSIDPMGLPADERLRFIRGLPHDLFIMLGGLQYDKYDALLFIASHAGCYSDGNNVSHTFSSMIHSFKINGVEMSEFTIGALMAAYLNVPIVFMSGDKAACEEAEALLPGMKTVRTMEAICGKANMSKHPLIAAKEIKEGVKEILSKKDFSRLVPKLPESFDVVMSFNNHARAFNYSFFPGVERLNARELRLRTKDLMDVLKFIHFTLIPNRPAEFEQM